MLSFWYNIGRIYVRLIPQGVVYGTARFLGFMSFIFDRKRKYVLKNLKTITNASGFKLIVLGIEFYVNFAFNIADYFILDVKGFDKIEVLTPLSEVRRTLEKLKDGTAGLVIPTAHLGNWEVAGAMVGILGFRAHGIGITSEGK